MKDKIIEIIEEVGDVDGIPGLYTIEEAADAIMAVWREGNGRRMKWEYCYTVLGSYGHSEARYELLGSMSEQGWELVAVDHGIAYFKRPIGGLREAVEEIVADLFTEAFDNDKEEKEAAFKEEKDEEDKGESEGAWSWGYCPRCYHTHRCPKYSSSS